MSEKIKTKQNKKLKSKYRFVVLNDETFEEKFSLILTRRNVWIFTSVLAFTVIFLTSAAIIYTPLKYFIPGFGDYNYRGKILQLQFETDSLQQQMNSREVWLENVMNVAAGTIDSTKPDPTKIKTDKTAIDLNAVKPIEKELRDEVEEDDNFSLSLNADKSGGTVDEVKQMHLMDPVEGVITNPFDMANQHYGVDIATKTDAPVKAVLEGKIISTNYDLSAGWVVTIQHANNLISIYKYNAYATKLPGTYVRAGEVIAITGMAGEQSTSPHLHFELWHEGRSLNPKEYIVF